MQNKLYSAVSLCEDIEAACRNPHLAGYSACDKPLSECVYLKDIAGLPKGVFYKNIYILLEIKNYLKKVKIWANL